MSDTGRQVTAKWRTQSPQSLIRYAQRRLEGHDALEWLLLPGLRTVQRRLERPPPPGPLPTLGKGQQLAQIALPSAATGAVVRVDSSAAITDILLEARPGTRIVIAPGRYHFDKTLRLGQNGSASAPITMTAIVPGTVRLDFSQEEGILVDRPYWIFENLNIRGVCPSQHACEHAFHVVGAGAFAVVRNNHVQDFNAHIKVNGFNGEWPDHGLVSFNTLTNTAARQTERPVVMLDMVGANHWTVQDNLVTNFAKAGGNRVAYGLFMKGGGENGRMERNLVICSPSHLSEPGERVGISFGGGRTDPGVCRTEGCLGYEHRSGLVANNIVAHCNDSGIDINHSRQITVAHNTLVNTAGLSIRGESSQTHLFGNLYEGKISGVYGVTGQSEWNLNTRLSTFFMNPDLLLFNWIDFPEAIPLNVFVTNDFQKVTRGNNTLPGALERASSMKTVPSSRD